MIEFPLPLIELLGQWGSYIVYLLVGLFFGFILENAGFGNSKKLAAQFYFKDLSVFKVMFSAIIVAMSLIFLSTALGLLDYNLIWVPPIWITITYSPFLNFLIWKLNITRSLRTNAKG